MAGPFAWTVSDGRVNLDLITMAGSAPPSPIVTTYFQVGSPTDPQPVPLSAAELALQEISKQCDITIIGLDGDFGSTTEIHFACSASAFGWGSDTPPYDVPPADQPEDPTAAAPQMQAAVRSLDTITVYVAAGAAPDPTNTPVTDDVDMTTVTITEVPFVLA